MFQTQNFFYTKGIYLYIHLFIQAYEAEYNFGRKSELEALKETIEYQKKELWRTEAQKHIVQAKRENVAIQLEAIYRERALQAYNQVLYLILKKILYITVK